MEALLVGFRENANIRAFVFNCVQPNHSKTQVVVSADVSLARRYKIALQELPLICKRLLESTPGDNVEAAITLTEERMSRILSERLDAAAKKPTKTSRPAPQAGRAWRTGFAPTLKP